MPLNLPIPAHWLDYDILPDNRIEIFDTSTGATVQYLAIYPMDGLPVDHAARVAFSNWLANRPVNRSREIEPLTIALFAAALAFCGWLAFAFVAAMTGSN